MPTTIQLVEEVVDSFAHDKTRSRVLAVDRQTLIDLGLILIDPERPKRDGYRWLEEELGEGVIGQSAYYCFASEFFDRYSVVHARHNDRARRIAEAAIDQAAGRDQTMAEVIKAHLMRLMAEGVVTANHLHQIDGKSLSAILAMLDGHSRAQHQAEELALKRADADRKATKLEADLAKLRQEMQLKAQRIDERVKALQSRIDELSTRSAKGEKIDPRIFEQIRNELAGIGEPNPESEAA